MEMKYPTVTRDFEADYWDVGDDHDVLEHETPEEAIEELLDWETSEDGEANPMVELYAYKRMNVDRGMAHKWSEALDVLISLLDEHYGNPEESSVETKGMKAAHQKFIDTVIDEYFVWRCEPVGVMKVDLRKEIETLGGT